MRHGIGRGADRCGARRDGRGECILAAPASIAIRYGYYRFQTDVMIAAVVLLVVVVQLVQVVGDRVARAVDHR